MPKKILTEPPLHELRALSAELAVTIEHSEEVIVGAAPEGSVDSETVLIRLVESVGVVASLREEGVSQLVVARGDLYDPRPVRGEKLSGNPREASDSPFLVSAQAELVNLVVVRRI